MSFFELMSFTGLFELLFSGIHGSVKRYKELGKIEFYDFEFDSDDKARKDYQYITKIQEGAIEFINEFSESIYKNYVLWDKKSSF